ncbi:MAG: anti-sigma factor [candidate division Zixibacteria bacterium]|nr:anti-sigma factor [candidate division Zixibacteria bacterium]
MSPTSIDSAFDSRLVAQVASGDAKAVGKLFDRYAGLAYSLAVQMIREEAKAEQTVFELFVRLWHEAAGLDTSREEVKTRIYQITYALATAQLPASDKTAEQFENLTDIELEEVLSKQLPAPELLEKLKAKLMATIDLEKPKQASPSPTGTNSGPSLYGTPSVSNIAGGSRAIWPLLAFGFGIIAGLLAVYSSFNARRLSGQLRESTIEFVALRQELKTTQAKLDFALSPQTEVLTLTGQPSTPTARAKLVWDPAEGQGILLTSGLAPAPADKSYQLWVIAGGKPVSVAVFVVDSTGKAEVRFAHLPPSEQVYAFNVTLELSGGVAEPTGDKLLSGSRL